MILLETIRLANLTLAELHLQRPREEVLDALLAVAAEVAAAEQPIRRAVVRSASDKLLAHYRSSDRLLNGGDLSSDREERIKHLLSRTLKVQLGKG